MFPQYYDKYMHVLGPGPLEDCLNGGAVWLVIVVVPQGNCLAHLDDSPNGEQFWPIMR
jgi:hypothetical protein